MFLWNFNCIYNILKKQNPKVFQKDEYDPTLMAGGKFWPYAQDGMFDEKSGSYDAKK